MKKKNVFLCLLFAFFVSCDNNGPYLLPKYQAVGSVIGKETCHVEGAQDYWLVSIFSSLSKRQEYGDSLDIDGVQYTNVIRAFGLADKLKVAGGKVWIEFNINETASIITHCDVSSPVVYKLKTAYIIDSNPVEF